MKKDKRDWSHSISSSSAVRGAYIASSKFVFVRGQGASPCRATANTRKRCWRSPQASQALCAMEWKRLRSLLLRRHRSAPESTERNSRRHGMAAATLITAIAIGECYRLVAAGT